MRCFFFFHVLLLCSFSGRGQATGTCWPYRMVGNSIVVEMRMNGQSRLFIFDTGAGKTCLSDELCRELALPVYDSTEVTDVHSNKSVYRRVLVDEFATPDLKFRFTRVPVLVVTSSVLVCHGVDGILGSDLLKYTVVEIDGKSRTIRLIPTREGTTASLRRMLPFVKEGTMPVIMLRVGYEQVIPVLFDTGSSRFLTLKESDYRNLKGAALLAGEDRGFGTRSMGIAGIAKPDTIYRVKLPELSVAGIRFANVSSETSNSPYSLLGVKLLDHGKVTIDYPNRRFFFEPYDEKERDLSEAYYPFGLRIKDGDIVVSTVWSKFAGVIEPGDKVTAINGKPVGTYDFCESVINGIPELKGKKKNRLTLVTSRGEKSVVYKKEY